MLRALIATATLAAVAWPTPSDACSKRHQTPFELFDEATTVAFVNVRKTPGGPGKIVAGDVELAVTRVIKGAKVQTITAKESETSCRARYQPGTDVLVFLAPSGFTVGAHDGHIRDAAAWKPVIDRWAQAADPGARAAVLVDAIAGPSPAVATEAIAFLLDEPVLLDQVSAEQTRQIAQAARALPKDPLAVMLLVRLRDPSAPTRANVAFWSRAAKRVLAVRDFTAVTDPARLAAAIAAGRADDDPKRVAAMERCERVHGKKLLPFGRYFGGAGSPAMWTDIAAACRTGQPIQ